MSDVQVTVVPMGATAIKSQNQAFKIAILSTKNSRNYRESQRKNLPSNKRPK